MGMRGENLRWALPRPSDPRSPPKAETGGEGATTRGTQRQGGGADEQKYLTLGNNCWKLIKDVKEG